VVLIDCRVLLLQRPESDYMGGIYELPSGQVERGETLQAALARELEEETGLQIAQITGYLGHFDYPSGSGRPTRQFNFQVAVQTPFEIQLQEHVRYAWAGRDELGQFRVTDSVRNVLDLVWILASDGNV